MVCNGKSSSSNSVFRDFSAVPVFRGVLGCSGAFQSVSVFPCSAVPGFSTCHSLKVHLTPKFFFGRDETVQHSDKDFDNFISIW